MSRRSPSRPREEPRTRSSAGGSGRCPPPCPPCRTLWWAVPSRPRFGTARSRSVPSASRRGSLGAEELLAAAPVGGVRVEDLARVVLEEDAVAGEILKTRLDVAEVVVAAPGRDLLGREGDVEVVVEVRAVGRDPAKAPSHPRAHGLDLADGGASHAH